MNVHTNMQILEYEKIENNGVITSEIVSNEFIKNNLLLQERQLVGFNERLQVITESIAVIKEAPIFGNGFGYTYTMNPGPHNMFLRALLDGGALGLIGLLLLFFAIARIGIKRQNKVLIVFVMVLFTIAMTNHNLTEERSLLFIIGILLSTPLLSTKSSP